MVVQDRLTKMVHFIPCKETITAKETAELFMHQVGRLHGLPQAIVSDRGPQFRSKFWHALWARLGVKTALTTAYHPQANGQVERVNQTLEQYLRCFSTYNQDDWTELLPTAELAFNNSAHSVTGM